MNNAKSYIVRNVLGIALVAVLVWLDQFTKSLVVAKLKGQDSFVIIKNILELQYAENRGAAFGIFQGRQLPITIISILIILFIVFMFEACPMIKRMIPLLVGYVVIMAGAIGNMIDRIVNGYVVDFIYFKIINFPNFNVADICVTCGCIYLVLLFMFYYKDGDNLTVFAKSKETDND
ncbi:MAG: signal peptidase II [Lachnospiraceae bacterium]|nr:signal peptidase II [Lachnospiraceae bacterium]